MRGLRLVDLPQMRLSAGTGRRLGHWLSAGLLLILAACSSGPPQQPSSGVAYAGPLTINLRKDLASKSPAVASVKHGDKLDVIEIRRRFIKVRTAQGVEGWTDSNLLLTDQQMGDLRRLAEDAAKLESQGKATPFDVLNMHSAPARQSPSFFQIAEGESVEVIGHRLAPHAAPPEPVRLPAPVKRAPPTKKSKAKEAKAAQAPPDATSSAASSKLAGSFQTSGRRAPGTHATCPTCARGRAAVRRLEPGTDQGRQGRLGAGPHVDDVDSG